MNAAQRTLRLGSWSIAALACATLIGCKPVPKPETTVPATPAPSVGTTPTPGTAASMPMPAASS